MYVGSARKSAATDSSEQTSLLDCLQWLLYGSLCAARLARMGLSAACWAYSPRWLKA